MRFYRVSLGDEADGHSGYSWFTSRREADAAVAEFLKANTPTDGSENLLQTNVEEVHIVPTRTGIRQALNQYAGYPNNG